jgi:hypothetical protein
MLETVDTALSNFQNSIAHCNENLPDFERWHEQNASKCVHPRTLGISAELLPNYGSAERDEDFYKEAMKPGTGIQEQLLVAVPAFLVSL